MFGVSPRGSSCSDCAAISECLNPLKPALVHFFQAGKSTQFRVERVLLMPRGHRDDTIFSCAFWLMLTRGADR